MVAGALVLPIGDCDEVFNYWEPTHYVLYGSGLQTWEYSPAYGLRSYAYIALHALIALAIPSRDRVVVFFGVRAALALIGAFSQTVLVGAVARRFGRTVAVLSAVVMALSPGILAASSAYLPQSFAMYAVTLSVAAWMSSRTAAAVFFMGVAGLIGWPFVVLAAIPMAIDMVARGRLFVALRAAILTAIACVVPSVAVDLYYYRTAFVAVANIVRYNVFTSHGANLYGVEPWHFLLRNLALNFNVALFAALAAVPSSLVSRKVRSSLRFLTPVAAFVLVFSSLAHKEERFLYPVYPLIAVAAAVTLSRVRRRMRSLVLIAFAVLSLSRTVSMWRNYSAPFNVYRRVPAGVPARVCVGKEWYRFPSSFFLPTADSHLLFLRSGFTGLLPKPFERSANGTWIIPTEMNEDNREEPSRYVSASACDYIVDLDLEHQNEPHYSAQPDWHVRYSAPFLDAEHSNFMARAFALPGVPTRFTTFRPYQLLERRKDAVSAAV
ncbi:hypothetical protein PBRA_006630 [Plasmodiophora brassicae]|nr:hypothetical protein PBRA_006630 [Plasmodiophora brassicae]